MAIFISGRGSNMRALIDDMKNERNHPGNPKLVVSNNINAEIYAGSSGFKAQLKYADKRNCKYAILCGEDEVAKELVTLKNLEIGSKISEEIDSREDWTQAKDAQKTFPLTSLIEEIKK